MNYLLLFGIFCVTYVNSFKNFKNWVMNDYIPRHKKHKNWWYNPIIHTFGNNGFGGYIHAEFAPFTTKLIDKKAYNGINVRLEIIENELKEFENNKSFIAVDFGCGVGVSTRCLEKWIDDNNIKCAQTYGIDTSYQMLEKARNIDKDSSIIYSKRNVINNPLSHLNDKVDVVTIMYLLHEVPAEKHYEILNAAYNLLKKDGVLIVADISENYNPSIPMLMGEPYLLDYQKNIRSVIRKSIKCEKFDVKNGKFIEEFIEDHVSLTVLIKK